MPRVADAPTDREPSINEPADPLPAGCRDWVDHVIVCGLEDLGLRTVEQLHHAGARVVVLDDGRDDRFARTVRGWGIPVLSHGARLAEPLFDAGLAGAAAVICVESSDLRTLETVLLVRELRPDVRVVAHIDNPGVAHAVEEVTGAGTVLDIPGLFAPSVIEVCLGSRVHDILLGSTQFATAEVVATRDGTLRELYGSLVPLGISSDPEPEPVLCPGRDEPVRAGDRVTLLGTRDMLATAGAERRPRSARRGSGALLRRVGGVLRSIDHTLRDSDRALEAAVAMFAALLVTSTLVLHFAYDKSGGGHPDILTSIYFTLETAATVGFGDFTFSGQGSWLEIFGIALIVIGTTLVAAIFALLTNALVSRRIERSLGHAKIPGMRDHVVLVGLGSVGMRIIEGVLARGRDIVVVERSESNRYLNQVRQHGVPLVLGDATLAQTLESINLSRAAAVAIVTSDDMTNIEIALAVRDRLGERWGDVPVVVRVFDRELGARLEQSFAFRQVWSTAAISAPWLVGAVLGMDVLFSFYVGNRTFLLSRLRVTADGGLAGLAMNELEARIRVIAIGRQGSVELEHPPRRDTRLLPGDDAYLAGPYEELQRVLRRERAGAHS
jgi:Trk K+ transport system NAD-binding subunit